MDLEKYQELKKTMEENSFEGTYSSIERLLLYSSYLGNAASIVLAFFFVNNIISSIENLVPQQEYVFPVLVVVFLTAFELLKRFVFKQVVLDLLIHNYEITIKAILSISFATMLVGCSFYLSLHGAREIVDGSSKIEQGADSLFEKRKSDIENQYNVEIKDLKDKINFSFDNAKSRGDKGLSSKEREDIKRWEQNIEQLKQEEEKEVTKLTEELMQKSSKELTAIHSNVISFVLLSAIVELLILVGVGFSSFFWYTVFNEFKVRLERNPNYKKYKLYIQLLTILFQNGQKQIDDTLLTKSQFDQLVKGQHTSVTQKEIQEFFITLTQLEVVQVIANKRKAVCSFEKAQEKVKHSLIK